MQLEQNITTDRFNTLLVKPFFWQLLLLKSLGFDFVINPSNADEDYPLNLKGHEIPVFLAEKKASSFNGVLTETDLLITADTIVWCEGEIFNKPINFEMSFLYAFTILFFAAFLLVFIVVFKLNKKRFV